jgi:hypothetical protein
MTRQHYRPRTHIVAGTFASLHKTTGTEFSWCKTRADLHKVTPCRKKVAFSKERSPTPAHQRLSVDSTARTSLSRQRGGSCQTACHELSKDVLLALFGPELRIHRSFVHLVRTGVVFSANHLINLNLRQPRTQRSQIGVHTHPTIHQRGYQLVLAVLYWLCCVVLCHTMRPRKNSASCKQRSHTRYTTKRSIETSNRKLLSSSC